MRAEHTVRFWNALRAAKLKPEDYCTAKDLAADLNCPVEKIHWMATAGWIEHVRVGGNSTLSDKQKLYAIPEDEAILIVTHEHPKIEQILGCANNHTSGNQRWKNDEERTSTEEQEKESLAKIDQGVV